MNSFKYLYICIVSLAVISESPANAEEFVDCVIGERTTVLKKDQFGFNAFPDLPISVIDRRPLRYLLTVGWQGSTYLMEGNSFESSRPVKKVLSPSQKSGAYDEKYAGIGSSVKLPQNGEILSFVHGEQHTGGMKDGVYRFYATVGLVVSNDGGRSFSRVGPVISGRPQDPNWKGTAQGNANASVIIDHTGKWLYAYYTEHSRRDPASGRVRSVVTLSLIHI